MSGRMALQIKRYGRSFAILIALVLIGTGAGSYILLQQRLPNPFQTFYSVNAAFPTVAAVVPGLGEPVNVAGVRVGQITNTSLKDGQGIIHMAIDPAKLKALYRDAHADLVPNTPLKDMQVNIAPGTAAAGVLPHGGTIPVAQSTSPIDAEDLLQSLDTDTRTWLTSLITDLDNGTAGRGKDIHALLTALGPTSGQMRQIGDLLAARRLELASVVHNLGVLTHATSVKDGQLQTVVQAGAQTVQALASQDAAIKQAIGRLPATLSTARATLADVIPFANTLGPTATALLPIARHLPTTLAQTRTLFAEPVLLPLDQVKPFIRAVLPLASQIGPLTRDLSVAIPPLRSAFKVLNYTTNEIAYNPGGKNPGFLYWLAWFAHNADSFLSTGDAHGPLWRGLILGSCAGFKAGAVGPLVQTLLGTTFGC